MYRSIAGLHKHNHQHTSTVNERGGGNVRQISRQEVRNGLGSNLILEVLRTRVDSRCLQSGSLDLLRFLVDDVVDVGDGNLVSLDGRLAVVDPRPDLTSRDCNSAYQRRAQRAVPQASSLSAVAASEKRDGCQRRAQYDERGDAPSIMLLTGTQPNPPIQFPQ